MWIDKLIHCAPNERQLRNIYLEQLCRHSQKQVLGPPFSCPPSEGPLQMIPQQFLVKQGVVLDKPVTSTVTSQTECEMTAWSDMTNCLTSPSYPQDSLHGKRHRPVRKVVSNTSTAISENIHRTRFKRHNNRIHFKRYNKSQSLIRTKNQRKFKKPSGNSNEDFLKETEEDLEIGKTTVVELEAIDKEQLIDREKILDKEKIIELEKNVSEIEKENSILKEQLEEVTNKKLEMDSVQESLKNEVLHLKEKLNLIEKIKNALEEEHKEFVDNTLSVLSAHVNSAIRKNDELAEMLHSENQEILELKKSHSEIVLGYKSNISDLKKDIAKKHKEVDRLEKQLQEHCGRMKTEVENIKQELENSKELKAKNIIYKSKIMKLSSKIIKLIEHNKKMSDCYEQKINVLKKSKDMELWVQKLSFGSSLTNGKKQELECIVSALEEKFRKQLTNATQITLHNIDPTIKHLQNFYESEDNENNE